MADFYYRLGESVVGPLTGIELRETAFAGQLTSNTLVATTEDGPWVPANRVNGLYDQNGRPLPHPPEALRILERANALAVDLLPPPPLADYVDEPPQPEPQVVPPPLPTPPFQLTPPQQPADQTSTPQPASPSPVHRSRPSSRPRRYTNVDARPVVVTLGVGVVLALVLLLAVVLNSRDDEHAAPSEAAITHAPSRSSKTAKQRPIEQQPISKQFNGSEREEYDEPTIGGPSSESAQNTADADPEWTRLNSDAGLAELVESLTSKISIQRVFYTGRFKSDRSDPDCYLIFSEPKGDTGDPFGNALVSDLDPDARDVPTTVVIVTAYPTTLEAAAAAKRGYMKASYGRFVFDGPTECRRQILNALR